MAAAIRKKCEATFDAADAVVVQVEREFCGLELTASGPAGAIARQLTGLSRRREPDESQLPGFDLFVVPSTTR